MKIVLVFIGAVVGAGFASGAEIAAYFTAYGRAGFWGILIAGVLFAVSAWGILTLIWENRVQSFEEAAELLADKKMGTVIDVLVTGLMLVGMGVMLAGTGEIFRQQWGLPFWLGSAVMGLLCWLALRKGEEGILSVNQWLSPVLIVGILILGVVAVSDAGRVGAAALSEKPIMVFMPRGMDLFVEASGSSVLYVSYNVLSSAPVLVGLEAEIRGRRQIFLCSVAIGAILGVLLLSAGVATFLNYDTIKGISVPALKVLEWHPWIRRIYAPVLLGAMYTTAVADGFGVDLKLRQFCKLSMGWRATVVVLGAAGVSLLGFGKLVTEGYLIFGYFGLGVLVLLGRYYIRKRLGRSAGVCDGRTREKDRK